MILVLNEGLLCYSNTMNKVFLGLGANLGDRGANLQRALVDLERWGVKILQSSSIYETEPVGNKNQPWFYNMAVRAGTDLRPEDLLKVISVIELGLGRKRESQDQWQGREVRIRLGRKSSEDSGKIVEKDSGPRPIDIDILFYENEIIDLPDLQIPHPGIEKRKFVLIPFAEIVPDFVHPVLKKSVKQLLNDCNDRAIVRSL